MDKWVMAELGVGTDLWGRFASEKWGLTKIWRVKPQTCGNCHTSCVCVCFFAKLSVFVFQLSQPRGRSPMGHLRPCQHWSQLAPDWMTPQPMAMIRQTTRSQWQRVANAARERASLDEKQCHHNHHHNHPGCPWNYAFVCCFH